MLPKITGMYLEKPQISVITEMTYRSAVTINISDPVVGIFARMDGRETSQNRAFYSFSKSVRAIRPLG